MNPSIASCEQLLSAMVGIDTVNGNISGKPNAEQELAQYLKSQAQAWGLATTSLPVADHGFNLLVSCRVGGAAAPWLLFESHMDTVGAKGMTIEPFTGRVNNGRMYGRGACDTKSSGAAMLWALRQYAQSNNQPNNVAIVFTLDEEISKIGARTFVDTHLDSLDWRPAGVIVGEPTMMQPIIAHNGMVRWTIQTQGRAAHSCDPAKGRSAISMMAKVMDAIESNYIASLKATHPLTGKAQCSINVIHGGMQVNVIPDDCRIHLDRRVVPCEDAEQVLPAVEQVLEQLRQTQRHLKVQQLDTYIDPPHDPVGSEMLAQFVEDVLKTMKLPCQAGGVAYGTDASTFSTAGVPAVVIGPGDIAQAHTVDEWLALDQLQLAVEVYGKMMSQPATF
jgi:acetylornithine deacetylase